MPKKNMSVAPLNISKAQRKKQEEQIKQIEQLGNKEVKTEKKKSASEPQKKSYLEALKGKKQENSSVNSEAGVGQISEKDSIASSDKDNVASRINANGSNISFDGESIKYDANFDSYKGRTKSDSPLNIPFDELAISDAESVPSKVSSINADNDSVNNLETIVSSVASGAKPKDKPALERKTSDESWVSLISASFEKLEKDDLSEASKSQKAGYYR